MGFWRNDKAEKMAILAVEEGHGIPDSHVVIPSTPDGEEASVQSRRSEDLRYFPLTLRAANAEG